jgi:hypothetical protein
MIGFIIFSIVVLAFLIRFTSGPYGTWGISREVRNLEIVDKVNGDYARFMNGEITGDVGQEERSAAHHVPWSYFFVDSAESARRTFIKKNTRSLEKLLSSLNFKSFVRHTSDRITSDSANIRSPRVKSYFVSHHEGSHPSYLKKLLPKAFVAVIESVRENFMRLLKTLEEKGPMPVDYVLKTFRRARFDLANHLKTRLYEELTELQRSIIEESSQMQVSPPERNPYRSIIEESSQMQGSPSERNPYDSKDRETASIGLANRCISCIHKDVLQEYYFCIGECLAKEYEKELRALCTTSLGCMKRAVWWGTGVKASELKCYEIVMARICSDTEKVRSLIHTHGEALGLSK